MALKLLHNKLFKTHTSTYYLTHIKVKLCFCASTNKCGCPLSSSTTVQNKVYRDENWIFGNAKVNINLSNNVISAETSFICFVKITTTIYEF